MNAIPQKQNDIKQIELLLVQRYLYSRAKIYFTCRVIFALAFAIGGPIVASLWESSSGYIGAASLICLLVNILIFERLESNNKIDASKIQELFDLNLFELPWNEYVTGRKPDPEIVAHVLNKIHNKDFSFLNDWYAKDVGKVDLRLATLLCQRSNAWWDTSLRTSYLILISISFFLIAVAVIFIAVALKLTVITLVAGIIMPTLPFIELAIRQINENKEATVRTEELKLNIDTEIERWISGHPSDMQESIARTFQDQIWRHRSKCPMVFDWVHKIYRTDHENQMQFSVRLKVEEYISKNLGV